VTGFHAAFDRALTGDLESLRPHLEPGDRTLGALAVYRNTTIKGRIKSNTCRHSQIKRVGSSLHGNFNKLFAHIH